MPSISIPIEKFTPDHIHWLEEHIGKSRCSFEVDDLLQTSLFNPIIHCDEAAHWMICTSNFDDDPNRYQNTHIIVIIYDDKKFVDFVLKF